MCSTTNSTNKHSTYIRSYTNVHATQSIVSCKLGHGKGWRGSGDPSADFSAVLLRNPSSSAWGKWGHVRDWKEIVKVCTIVHVGCVCVCTRACVSIHMHACCTHTHAQYTYKPQFFQFSLFDFIESLLPVESNGNHVQYMDICT